MNSLTMPLLRFFRWPKRLVSESEGSLSQTSNADVANNDIDKHESSKQEADPTVTEVASLSNPEVTAESDPGLNPGELTFDEGMSCH